MTDLQTPRRPPEPFAERWADAPNPAFDALFRSPVPLESEAEERIVEAARYEALFDLILSAYEEWKQPRRP